MNSRIRKAVSISLTTLAALFIAHSTIAQNIDKAMLAYGEKFTAERTYLHYDKAAYSPGEIIWFKAYLMSEVLPADKSKTLYVDWLDDKGNLLLHAVSPIVDAVTNGQFELPADYKGRYVQVKAYTKWMLNFDSAFLYRKSIRILNKETNAGTNRNPAIPSINFFPEGGDAVAGINNKIAFKANDQYGMPVRVKGIVTNSQGKFQDSIRSLHDGMGYFFLTPQANETYIAKWKDEKAVEHSTNLPSIKSSGIVAQVSLAGSNRYLNIRYGDAKPDTLHIVGSMYQHPAFNIARATNTAGIKLTIPTAGLPSGILTITVFDNNWNALAERITYVDNAEYIFQPEFEVQHWGLNKRAKNEIKITIPDSIVANLSISVTDQGIGVDSSSNIISHLLLSSELKGDVYNASQYFSDHSDAMSQKLDLVMLTHGWRRFKWQEVLSGKIPKTKFDRDTTYMSLSGKLYGVLPSQITPGASIVLVVKREKDGKFLLLPIHPDGSFNDPEVILFDTANIYYQFQNAKSLTDASVQFMVDRLPAPIAQPTTSGIYNFWPDTTGMYRQLALAAELNKINELLRVKTLENVTVKSKTKSALELMDEKYASALFQGDSYQFDLLSDPLAASTLNIFTYLQGKVAGLQINTNGNTPSLQWRGGSPQIYVDEVQADPAFVASVSVKDIAYVKVFRPPFMGGFNGANGAIAIYTRKGNDSRSEPGKGLSNNKVYGYTRIREFYSPNYGTFRQGNEQKDLRTTLYWNPSVLASPQKREIILSFYNNDVSDAFRVVIEGMTTDGKLAHIEQIME